ncbi:MAG: hypothetical protein KJ908_04690 [Acidobacteria bacterium]|nr:hypothetical protein [Acidobacteriota bacterium]MBU4494729.1 hypothetical protein [Acidobacteriota bacterium]MCG2814891.1 hypothetical protein [Candidatus Aminicenantes bacterium]
MPTPCRKWNTGADNSGQLYFENKSRGPIGFGKPAPVPAWLDYELWQGPAPPSIRITSARSTAISGTSPSGPGWEPKV